MACEACSLPSSLFLCLVPTGKGQWSSGEEAVEEGGEDSQEGTETETGGKGGGLEGREITALFPPQKATREFLSSANVVLSTNTGASVDGPLS